MPRRLPSGRRRSSVAGARNSVNRTCHGRGDAHHPLALWPYHGVFGAGTTLDETFGLIDTAEKAAEVLVKVLSMGGPAIP